MPQQAPLTGSEDFAVLLEKSEGSDLLRGNGTGQGIGEGGCLVHKPNRDFNDRCLGTGASSWARLTRTLLKQRGRPLRHCAPGAMPCKYRPRLHLLFAGLILRAWKAPPCRPLNP